MTFCRIKDLLKVIVAEKDLFNGCPKKTKPRYFTELISIPKRE